MVKKKRVHIDPNGSKCVQIGLISPKGPNESNQNGSKWDQGGPKGPNGSYWALEYKWIKIGQFWATVYSNGFTLVQRIKMEDQ